MQGKGMESNVQLTVKIKLLASTEQEKLIDQTMREYIETVNNIVADMVTFKQFGKLSSGNVCAALPSALRGQCVVDSKSIYKRFCKTKIEPVLKKPVAIWNNQNYKVSENSLTFPVLIQGKCSRISVAALIPSETLERLESCKLGTMRITRKSGKLIAQIAVEVAEAMPIGAGVVGVDLGIKCPAVATSSNGKVLFSGNGRQNKYIRRKHKAKRKLLGKAKKLSAIKKLNNKEQRWMQDQDHKISRQLVNFALANGAGTIRLEQLTNIRKTAKTSRKNGHNLHTWSFFRLAQYIEYKARLAGITVEFINPAYTSQRCPACGELNHAKDRKYRCSCGYTQHRDLVGAINILSAPVASGNSLSA